MAGGFSVPANSRNQAVSTQKRRREDDENARGQKERQEWELKKYGSYVTNPDYPPSSHSSPSNETRCVQQNKEHVRLKKEKQEKSQQPLQGMFAGQPQGATVNEQASSSRLPTDFPFSGSRVPADGAPNLLQASQMLLFGLYQGANFHHQPSPHCFPYPLYGVVPSKEQLGTSSRTEAPVSPADWETFADVTTFIVPKVKAVKVTIGEIKRRLGAPESQNWKTIMRLTRHDTSTLPNRNAFRTKVASYFDSRFDDAEEPNATSLISTLLEEDALTLARDFKKLLSAELNTSIIASIACADEDYSSKNIALESIVDLLKGANSYITSCGRVPGQVGIEESSKNPAVHQFNLGTHGFGPIAVGAVIDSLLQVVMVIEKRRLPDQSHLAQLPEFPLKKDIDPETIAAATAVAANLAKRVASGHAVDLQLHSHQPNDNDVYDKAVIPRIKYFRDTIEASMTIGEARRRIYGPEKFTLSRFNEYIRKSKIKGTSTNVRDTMKNGHGFIFNPNSNKNIYDSSWMLVMEAESTKLSREVGTFIASLPPSQKMREAARAAPRDSLTWLRHVAGSLAEAMLRVGELPEKPVVKTEADMHILRFALITHHFGHTFYVSVMKWLIACYTP